jgi:hypothetical protein
MTIGEQIIKDSGVSFGGGTPFVNVTRQNRWNVLLNRTRISSQSGEQHECCYSIFVSQNGDIVIQIGNSNEISLSDFNINYYIFYDEKRHKQMINCQENYGVYVLGLIETVCKEYHKFRIVPHLDTISAKLDFQNKVNGFYAGVWFEKFFYEIDEFGFVNTKTKGNSLLINN